MVTPAAAAVVAAAAAAARSARPSTVFTRNLLPIRSFSAAKDTTTTTPRSPPEKDQYVHPLSQIVLEHLQKSQSDFVTSAGLDKSLDLKKDGTFTLKFPNDGGQIWTSYDPEEKKHWLTVHRGDLVGRYMLQDNMKPAWHSDRRSVPEKVQDAVDEMIRKLSEE